MITGNQLQGSTNNNSFANGSNHQNQSTANSNGISSGPPPLLNQAQASGSNRTLESLPQRQPQEDTPEPEVMDLTTIFRPNGDIIFPWSDGDSEFVAPNKTAPPSDATVINWYKVWTVNDPKALRWRQTIGQRVAQHFNQPANTEWKLQDFPTDYEFVEHRTGDRNKPRTDPYLYGESSAFLLEWKSKEGKNFRWIRRRVAKKKR